MANLRVFVSSTYYDLLHVRNDLFDFIKSMGYDPVMHDKGGVPYTQDTTMEQACYDELSMCDIVICVIGNRYGTDSSVGNFSITLEELQQAIKAKKKVYTYILKDVYTENKIYEKNIAKFNFEPAYVDDIRIHEFISEFKKTVKKSPIHPFESVNEIIINLKAQFSGLFQHLLAKESAATETKTYYDLKEISEEIKDQVNLLQEQNVSFFKKFDSTIFALNRALKVICEFLGMKKCLFFAADKEALCEFLALLGFEIEHNSDGTATFLPDEETVFVRIKNGQRETICLKNELFESNEEIKEFRSARQLDGIIVFDRSPISEDDDNLPF